ncbi:MAG TPA: HU family DNA-binding protein [Solirubrobacteraceae bacterium]|jgi:DNA-binding protein HU-beta|nr:HU family DNA-binding protein [Solirubrobacteraceae bacterium]
MPAPPVASFGRSQSERRRHVTKSEFVDRLASSHDLSKKQAEAAVDAVIDGIEKALARGEEVSLTGFGKFHVAQRGAREGKHPRTGERIQIAASQVPRFTAGAKLKQAVRS